MYIVINYIVGLILNILIFIVILPHSTLLLYKLNTSLKYEENTHRKKAQIISW